MDASPVIDKINAFFGFFTAILSYIFGIHWILFVSYFGLNVVDTITGSIDARLKGESSSKEGLKGILKKLGYWMMILVSFSMGVIFIEIGKVININLSFMTSIGWYTLAALIVNEIRSIIENFVDSGYFKVPTILVKGLEVANNAIDGVMKIDSNGKVVEIEHDTTADDLLRKGQIILKIEDAEKPNDSGG